MSTPSPRASVMVRDALSRAVKDFEDMLQKSTPSSSTPFPLEPPPPSRRYGKSKSGKKHFLPGGQFESRDDTRWPRFVASWSLRSPWPTERAPQRPWKGPWKGDRAHNTGASPAPPSAPPLQSGFCVATFDGLFITLFFYRVVQLSFIVILFADR